MDNPEQRVIEAAGYIAHVFEKGAGLEPGSLLAEAWIGANDTLRRMGERAHYGNLCQGARWNLMRALKAGEKDGVRRFNETQRRRIMKVGFDLGEEMRLDPPAREEPEPGTRDEARAILRRITELHGRSSSWRTTTRARRQARSSA